MRLFSLQALKYISLKFLYILHIDRPFPYDLAQLRGGKSNRKNSGVPPWPALGETQRPLWLGNVGGGTRDRTRWGPRTGEERLGGSKAEGLAIRA